MIINPESNVNPELANVGVAYLATINNSKVIDLNTKPFPKNRFLNFESDNVFISVRPFSLNESKRIESLYKTKFPKSKVSSITGIIDIFCCYPFVKLAKNTNLDNEFSDSLPFPKYELFDSFGIFKNKWGSGEWLYPIMTSLGCPYQCVYCKSHNRKWVPRSAKNCYEELKRAKLKYGIQSFTPVDDCFNLDKERVLEFCQLIKPLNLKWICTNGLRADRFDEEIAKAMANSGCVHVGFGMECLDSEVLKKVKKGVTVEQIKKATKISNKYFKNVHGFFIIGLPGSSYKKDLNSLKWAIKQGITAHFSLHIPFDDHYSEESFYGIKTKIKSNEYSKKQQMKIYTLTKYMRGDNTSHFLLKMLDRIKLIWLFDKRNLFKHIKWEVIKRI
jgi:radical SAM superfamily enzyme YgiQ (UPF0313 family)